MNNNKRIEFSVGDVKALAEHILSSYVRYNNNGPDWCDGCGCYLDHLTGKGEHEQNCVTKIAQDVLTGIKD